MGGGRWSASTYTARVSHKAATGTPTFDYHDTAHATGKVHADLDPKWKNTMDQQIRESRDSTEHPETTAVAVFFDVTGSMASLPRVIQTKLPGLLGLILRKGYLEHPQVMFGAIGDATTDRIPLQVGQFESDNRMDENLEHFYLEGGGGGQKMESYELAAYFVNNYVSHDCWEKRGKKGYLFFVGDEMAYPKASQQLIREVIGAGAQDDIPTELIMNELKERWEIFYILPTAAAHGGDKQVLDFWRNLLGQNVLELDDIDKVAETIALTIGLAEGVTDMTGALTDLAEAGLDTTNSKDLIKAVSSVKAGSMVATASRPISDDRDDGDGTVRV